jgi:hypothetical protein
MSGNGNGYCPEQNGGAHRKHTHRLMALAFGMLALWLVAPAAASASATWSLKGVPVVESSVAAKWSGKVKLTDNKVPIVSTFAVECEDSAEGKAGTGAAGEVTKWTVSKCVGVTNCTSPAMAAVNLPWSSELVNIGGTLYDKIVSGGKGAPGFSYECSGAKDTCTGTILTSMTNASQGVSAAFDSSEKLSCTLGGTGSGSLVGSQSIEAVSGGRLGAEEPPIWRVNGEALTKPKAVSWSGSMALTDSLPESGIVTVKCEDTGSGYVGLGAGGEVTKLTMTKCESGGCGVASLEASGLSWQTHLFGLEGTVGNAFGVGRLKMKCTSPNVTDECPLPTMTVTNTESGVSAVFNKKEKFSCTLGRSEHGELEGSQAIKTNGEGVVSVS